MSKQNIYDKLRRAGLSVNGALGLMGNFECESNCEACRLQGDFSKDRASSKAYAEAVDSGQISREAFSRDAKGWGLAQWTYWSRKAGLYDFAKARGKSIGDEAMQVEFCVKEMKESFPNVWAAVRRQDVDLGDAVEIVCKQYERPAINNIGARLSAANAIKAAIDTSGGGGDEQSPDTPTTRFWPPRMLDSGMIGSDVMALQALLLAHGYSVASVNGIFDGSTRSAATRFQAEHLGNTGAFGPRSWAALLKL